LGVTITVNNLEPEVMLDELHKGNHGQIVSSGWCADYPDPENFADVLFHTGTAMNYSNYNNPTLDNILENARVETDVAQRIDLYQQAEQIIVDDAPAIFLTHSLSYVLVKPYIKGYTLSPVSTFPGIRYLWMDKNYWK
jgi:ABC-type transport system substrate-binding protein